MRVVKLVQQRDDMKGVGTYLWLVIEINYGRGSIGMALEKWVGLNSFTCWTVEQEYMVSVFNSNQDFLAEMSTEYQWVREQWTGKCN